MMNRITLKQLSFLVIVFFLFSSTASVAQTISGKVFDKETGEPVLGATILLTGSSVATASGEDGSYLLKNLPANKSLEIECRFIGYSVHKETIMLQKEETKNIDFFLVSEDKQLDGVVVTGVRRRNTETAMISNIKNALTVSTGISAAQIVKTSDSDAAEIIKRVPGISLIENRFIIVRGLSQRYNNVSINNGAVPSSEADGRAFSFDIIPSSNIDNMMIIKSPTAELPGDFSGGFIKISTKNMPDENSLSLSVGTGINTVTHFKDFSLLQSSSTEWLGFDRCARPLSKDFPSHLGSITDPSQITYYTKTGFNNDWNVKTFRPLPDLKLNLTWNRKIGDKVGTILTFGYSNANKTIPDMQNTRYGIYSATADVPTIEKNYIDNQFTNEVKINVMNNWSFILDSRNRFEFRNLFSQIGKNRFTERYGTSTVSGEYYENQTEMLYSSRLSYVGQLAGLHTLDEDMTQTLNWTVDYSYANKMEPDRRIIKNIGGIPADKVITPDLPSYNDMINRYDQKLYDHIASVGADYKKSFSDRSWNPEIKSGIYGEYRIREYTPREFIYRYDRLSGDERVDYINLPYTEMMNEKWLGYDKVYIEETTRKSNAYDGKNSIAAAYVEGVFPFGAFQANLGVRAEWWNMSIKYDRAISASQILMTEYKYDKVSVLPSFNATYSFNDKNLIRLAYGRSVNRPEFREVSPAVYYDFELFAEVQGNPDLKMATIDNVDLRYELYPSAGETVSVGLFYKNFRNPIEWNFIDMGGSYRYSYENARSAYTTGVEVDIRKSLDFINIPDLTLVLNAAWVKSRVKFSDEGLVKEKDRPLQGQSPYIVNAGLYYTSSEKIGLSASLLYNIIGKRIVGVGKSTSVDGNSDYDVPDAYEMPRNVLDLTINKTFGKIVSLKLGIKDILAQSVIMKQFPTTTINGVKQEREQITRKYTPGRSISLSLSLKF